MRREIDKVGPLGTSGILAALSARINTHYALFGEPPKALFVSHAEAEQYERALNPVHRYIVHDVAAAGYDNLLFRGIPVIAVDNQMLIPQDQLQ